jgi:hypothetical protein
VNPAALIAAGAPPAVHSPPCFQQQETTMELILESVEDLLALAQERAREPKAPRRPRVRLEPWPTPLPRDRQQQSQEPHPMRQE